MEKIRRRHFELAMILIQGIRKRKTLEFAMASLKVYFLKLSSGLSKLFEHSFFIIISLFIPTFAYMLNILRVRVMYPLVTFAYDIKFVLKCALLYRSLFNSQ